MSTIATNAVTGIARRHAFFVAFVLISSLVFYKTLSALVHYSLSDASSSHIILIPFVSFFLLYFERERVFSSTTSNVRLATGVAAVGLVLYWAGSRGPVEWNGNWPIFAEVLAIVLFWTAGYLAFYGTAAMRAGSFSLLFLLLMVPPPDPILNWLINALQEGSTDIACLIFQAVGMPVLRHGFVLTLPTVTIEVAQECSSIRSSMALFITCLLAAHLYLRSGWKKWLFVLLTFPLSLIKNGIRIATLTLLSIYVNPDFLTGRLHHEGGVVFFLLALAMLVPVFLWFERTDKPRPASAAEAEPADGTRAEG
jgi:exosortase